MSDPIEKKIDTFINVIEGLVYLIVQDFTSEYDDLDGSRARNIKESRDLLKSTIIELLTDKTS